jgi:hypothetical protein
VTESGGTGDAGNRPPDGQPSANELPRWQPFADAPPAPSTPPPPPALPSDALLTQPPQHDEGSIVPEQLHDAPAYIPPPMGMTPGAVMPTTDPADVPTSAWITTAPQTAPPRAGIGSRVAGIIGGIVVLVIVGAFVFGLVVNDKGKVLFGTAAGSDLCSVGNKTDTVKTTDPIFFAAILKDHMDGAQAITFHITKDGAEFVSHEEPADGTSFDCYGNKDSLGALEVGTYTFEVLHTGTVEATGKLTVK